MTSQPERTVKKSSMAIFSLIIGIVSLLGAFFIPIFGLIGGLVAIIFGVLALREIKTQGFQGLGTAVTGIVLGSIGIAWTFVFLSMI